MSCSLPLALYNEDPHHDLDATALCIVRAFRAARAAPPIPTLAGNPMRLSTPLHAFTRQARAGMTFFSLIQVVAPKPAVHSGRGSAVHYLADVLHDHARGSTTRLASVC
jgi:hypothetical protein